MEEECNKVLCPKSSAVSNEKKRKILIEAVVVKHNGWCEVCCCYANKNNLGNATCFIDKTFCGFGSWNKNGKS